MEYIVQNITTNATTEIDVADHKLSYKTITLVNSNIAGNPVTVNLYLENKINAAERFAILTNLVIPGGTSLELGNTELEYLNPLTIYIRG
jgi:hypothetical protein